jgi:hypothetical protein
MLVFNFILLLMVFSDSKQRHVEAVTVFTRSGSEAPRNELSKKKTDLFKYSQPNSLLPVGKRQMYLLGKQLAKEYPRVWAQVMQTRNYTLISMNRIVQRVSALALFSGFLRDSTVLEIKGNQQKFMPPFTGRADSVNFATPLPEGTLNILTRISNYDNIEIMFELTSKNTCPNIDLNSVRREISRVNQNFTFEDSYQEIKQRFEINDQQDELQGATMLYKAARLYEYMRALRDSSTDAIYDTDRGYEDMRKAYEAYVTSTLPNKDFTRITTAPVLIMSTYQFLDFIYRQETVKYSSSTRFMVFSGNDKFLIGLLLNLGLFSRDCAYGPYSSKTFLRDPLRCVEFPEPGSSLVFELLDIDEDWYVQVKYNGQPMPFYGTSFTYDPNHRPIYDIPFGHFYELMKDTVDWDFAESCGLSDRSSESEVKLEKWLFLFVMWLGILMIVFSAMIYFFYLKSRPASVNQPDAESDSQRETKQY